MNGLVDTGNEKGRKSASMEMKEEEKGRKHSVWWRKVASWGRPDCAQDTLRHLPSHRFALPYFNCV